MKRVVGWLMVLSGVVYLIYCQIDAGKFGFGYYVAIGVQEASPQTNGEPVQVFKKVTGAFWPGKSPKIIEEFRLVTLTEDRYWELRDAANDPKNCYAAVLYVTPPYSWVDELEHPDC